MKIDIAIIGGGAAGFFTAINLKRKQPHLKIAIFEKSKTLLGKVQISGGGRCNVTHACFDNQTLVSYYPRGSKELLSVFERFNSTNTIEWFKKEGIELKTESDGRMFPISNTSETIVNCFLNACSKLGIEIYTQHAFESFTRTQWGFTLTINSNIWECKNLVMCSGSSNQIWHLLKENGIDIIPPVPSLFTFNIKHPLIKDLMGISLPDAIVSLDLKDKISKNQLKSFTQKGPVLITHWGLSGPGILKLSSIGARLLSNLAYKFNITLNAVGLEYEMVFESLKKHKTLHSKKSILTNPQFGLSNRFWQNICELSLETSKNWSDVSNSEMQLLSKNLTSFPLEVKGKSTFKDEFVTSGGVNLKTVDFKTMSSKTIEDLYFAGEVLDIDALTGGFNFQAAWSEAWVISESI